jgi:hypothetical protein
MHTHKYAQVFYHLGELDSALTYALGAGKHFNVDEQSEYVQTLVGEWSDPWLKRPGLACVPPTNSAASRCAHHQRLQPVTDTTPHFQPCAHTHTHTHTHTYTHTHAHTRTHTHTRNHHHIARRRSALPGPVL